MIFLFKKMLRGKKNMHPRACSTNLKQNKQTKKENIQKQNNFLLKIFIKETKSANTSE